MNGLLRRLTRRRAAPADETPPDTPAASEPVDAPAVQPGTGDQPLPEDEQRALDEQRAKDEQAARELRAAEEERARRARDVPAGLDASEIDSPPDTGARRGRMRRRIRYLRRVREVLLRDLGGFFYEVHRTAGGHQNSAHRAILETKTGRLAAIDGELTELETRLGEPRPAEAVVREPGIGGACPRCGELHGSDAHWCAHCGMPLTERATKLHDEAVDRTIAARQAPPEATASTAPDVESAPARPSRKIGWPRRRAKLEPDASEGGPATAATTVGADPATATTASADPATATTEATTTGGDTPATGAEPAAGDPDAAGGDTPATGAEPAAGDPDAAGGDTQATGAEPAAGDPDAAGGEAPTQKLSRSDPAAAGPGPNGDGQERPRFAERRS